MPKLPKVSLVFNAVLISIILSSCTFGATATFLDTELQTRYGKTTTLRALADNKPIYLKLWATWCQPCLEQMPHFNEIHNIYGGDLLVVGVNIGINESLGAVDNVIDSYDLNMPIVLDANSELAQEVGLKGTPLHILVDVDGNIVHKGTGVTDSLNEKISLLSTGEVTPLYSGANEPNTTQTKQQYSTGNHLLLFTATWCDWYLKDSRPQMASNCERANILAPELESIFDGYSAKIIISRLWTGDKELSEFKDKYNITLPLKIDSENTLFFSHSVKKFPTLLVIKDGKEVSRFTDINEESLKAYKLSSVKL
jgi:thiol-disulfide isomerase/thioredoxin